MALKPVLAVAMVVPVGPDPSNVLLELGGCCATTRPRLVSKSCSSCSCCSASNAAEMVFESSCQRRSSLSFSRGFFEAMLMQNVAVFNQVLSRNKKGDEERCSAGVGVECNRCGMIGGFIILPCACDFTNMDLGLKFEFRNRRTRVPNRKPKKWLPMPRNFSKSLLSKNKYFMNVHWYCASPLPKPHRDKPLPAALYCLSQLEHNSCVYGTTSHLINDTMGTLIFTW